MIKNASVESIINVSGIELKNKKETIKKEQEKKKLLLQAKLGKKKAG